MKRIAAILIACIICLGLVGCGGSGSSSNPSTPQGATVTSIKVASSSPSVVAGQTVQFTAEAVFSDNSTQDVTALATWRPSDPTSATINSAGQLTGIKAGNIDVTATWEGTTGSAPFTVTGATLTSIQVTPSSTPTPLNVNQTLQLTATGTYSDNSNANITSLVTWSSGSQLVATVSATGLATAVAPGNTTITASLGSVSSAPALISVAAAAQATLSSIVITPALTTLNVNQTQQLKANGIYSDNSTADLTNAVAWTFNPSNQSVATVSASGVVTAVASGSVTISASVGAISSNPATINVNATVLSSIVIAPASSSIPAGATQQFTATGHFTDGSSSDLTNSVAWSSDTPALATVNATGMSSAISVGTARIIATSAGVTSFAPLTVTSAVLQSIDIDPDGQSIAVGGQLQYAVTGTFSDGSNQTITNVTYSSSDPSIATIDPVTGVATGVVASTNPVTITATSGSFTDTASLTVLPPTLQSIAITTATPTTSLAVGSTAQFGLTGYYSDGSTGAILEGVSWASSNPAVAGVDPNGLVAAVTTGQVTIYATYNGLSAVGALTVVLGAPTSITVTPALPEIGVGGTLQFTATAVFGDGSSQDISSQVQWSSSLSNVALISSTGLASAVSLGTSQISATFEGVSGSSTLTVGSTKLLSINVTPANEVVPTRTSVQFTAWGVYNNGTTSVLHGVIWKTSSSHILRFSYFSNGLGRSRNVGTVTVSATLDGITGSTKLTVTNSTLASIAITPVNPTIAPGTTQQFTLTGTFGDGATVDLTRSAYWTTSNYHDAFVFYSGLVTGIGAGEVTVTGNFLGLSAQTTLTVSSASIVSVSVTPSAPSIDLGSTQQFAATGTFSDGTSQDVTDVSWWRSSDLGVAVVNWTGLATSARSGTSNITATFHNQAGTGVLTVN